jgi:hypothetical protein
MNVPGNTEKITSDITFSVIIAMSSKNLKKYVLANILRKTVCPNFAEIITYWLSVSLKNNRQRFPASLMAGPFQ